MTEEMLKCLALIIVCLTPCAAVRSRNVLPLIMRGKNGMLVANEDALTDLERLSTPMEVLSVVGGFHSGKSFLMNHLMSLPNGGFKVNWSVDPTTHGLQAWALPIVSSDKSLHVLVIDTEGLSATENDQDYDAKLFAISALISTQLLYCSQGKIDHRDIETLELLAQRSQLFAMKSAHATGSALSVNRNGSPQGVSKMQEPQHLQATSQAIVANSVVDPASADAAARKLDTVLKFPPLTWVVNSWQFPLDRTPKEYLDALLKQTSHATSGSLRNIFTETDAHLLAPPVTVADWSTLHTKATSELARPFLDQLDMLRAKLFTSMSSMRGTRRSGKELADLIRLCVDRANSGDMGSIPSMWVLVLKVSPPPPLHT